MLGENYWALVCSACCKHGKNILPFAQVTLRQGQYISCFNSKGMLFMLFVNLAFCFHSLNLIFVQFFLTSLLFFDKVMAFLELSIVVFLFFFLIFLLYSTIILLSFVFCPMLQYSECLHRYGNIKKLLVRT